MLGRIFIVLAWSTVLFASDADWKRAEDLYQHTDYTASLKVLDSVPSPDAKVYALTGKNYFMRGEYKKALEAFQKAMDLEPGNADHPLWLGRTYGRRAETGSPFTAPGNASKARQYLEKAVALDPSNEEAMADLFDYYLQAPGFLGGGIDKADALAKRMGKANPAEYYFAQAQLAERKKQFDTAEQHLRRAVAQAPRQVGRVVELAKYLAKQGRYQESDAAFQQAEQISPNNPRVIFAQADTYIREKRRLDDARILLQKYLQSDLTPDDPPREEAQKLLQQVSGV